MSHSCQQCMSDPVSQHLPQYLLWWLWVLFVCFLSLAILIGVVILHCGVNLHFSNGWWCWTSLHEFICHVYILFNEISAHGFCPFSNWIVHILLLSFESVLCILDTSNLLIMWFANTFHYSEACVFMGFYKSKSFNFNEV